MTNLQEPNGKYPERRRKVIANANGSERSPRAICERRVQHGLIRALKWHGGLRSGTGEAIRGDMDATHKQGRWTKYVKNIPLRRLGESPVEQRKNVKTLSWIRDWLGGGRDAGRTLMNWSVT